MKTDLPLESKAHESSNAAGERVELTETVTDINPANVGDINADKTVDVADMNTLLNIMLGRDSADKYGRRAYITKDNNIDVADLNELINIILKK